VRMVENDMRPAVVAWLRARGCEIAHEIQYFGYCDVTGIIYAPRTSRRIPKAERVIAVELKLRDISGVLAQAVSNKHFVDESYAAMPAAVCARMRDKSKGHFAAEGVGLLSVDGDTVSVAIPPEDNHVRKLGERLTRNLWAAVRRQKNNGHTTPASAADSQGRDGQGWLDAAIDNCENCRHRGTSPDDPPCSKCDRDETHTGTLWEYKKQVLPCTPSCRT
jgi:hypothetical protein